MDEQVETAVSSENGQDHQVEVEVVTPIVVDLGKTKRKHVKRLKRGEGRLMDEVVEVMEEIVDALGEEVDGKTLVPIVIVYEEKAKQSRNTITLPF